jgi:anaerobic magnesium-protoporphyrin IX monomethyl ester cyclase
MARVLLAKARNRTFEQRGMIPPLGVLYLAAVLRARGHVVSLYDAAADRDPAARLQDLVRQWGPDVLGLSAITPEQASMAELAAAARAARPGLSIVVGGPHASAYPERCLALPDLDFVVIGEGERPLPSLVEALARGEASPRVAGVIGAREGREAFDTARPDPVTDLDEIPFPAWDLLDLDLYWRAKSGSSIGVRPYMALATSRGCPYQCIYCHHVHTKRYRARSPENVLAELDTLHRRFRIRDFEFVDDTFNLDRERTLGILEGIARSGMRPALQFFNAVRADILDDELIDAFARAGTQYIAIAVETASPRLQALIRKRLDLEKTRRAISRIVDAGMFTSGYFMLGFPTEELSEARATVEFAVRSRLHQALFMTVTPFAGTPLHDEYQDLIRARGVPMDPDGFDYFSTRYNLSDMRDEELFRLQRSAYRRFYLDPRRVFQIARRHPRRAFLFREGLLALQKMLPR